MQDQRDAHEASLDRLHRRLRTLCQCTMTFFQAESEQELLQSVCEILVAGGEVRLAWIGYCEDDAEKTVRPVAQAGSASITWSASRLPGERGKPVRVQPALRLGPAKRVASMISGRIRGFRPGESPPSHAATLRALQFR